MSRSGGSGGYAGAKLLMDEHEKRPSREVALYGTTPQCGRGEIGRRSRLHRSARGETLGVEPLKFGESWGAKPCQSRAKPGLVGKV